MSAWKSVSFVFTWDNELGDDDGDEEAWRVVGG